jgi:hypothetical protein
MRVPLRMGCSQGLFWRLLHEAIPIKGLVVTMTTNNHDKIRSLEHQRVFSDVGLWADDTIPIEIWNSECRV